VSLDRESVPNPSMMNQQIPGYKIIILVLLLLPTVFIQAQDISTDTVVVAQGKELFDLNCKSCHRVKEKLVGPALAGVDQRVPSIQWIKDWVRNSAKVIASGDEYGNKIFNEYQKSQMTAFTSLKDEEIMAILAYVKYEENKKPDDGGGGKPPVKTEEASGALVTVILIGILVVLLLLLFILGYIASNLKKNLAQKELTEEDKEYAFAGVTVSSFVSSPAFIFITVFIIAGIGFKTVVDGLYTIGVQQGYQPAQPIAFSHKIHAGQFEIDCKYCHTGAIKGKSANIPSPNICMNCHSQIKTGTNTGEAEIKKIYDAIQKNEPIKWVRIHNLPDLAYFNHSQHVVVGGIECQTCHGPIQEMDVVKQYSLLTMGWCIDCHRKTDVNTKGNEYYDKLVKLHDEKKSGKVMKVEDIGGLECSKCHY
jgi:mono/diheme cytochrome c family protein